MSKYNIQRFKQTIDIADGQTIGNSVAANLNGILRGVLVDAPDLDGAVTLTVAVLLIDGAEEYTIFSQASIAENANTAILVDANNHPLSRPLSGNIQIRVTASGAQADDDDSVAVSLLVDRG